MQYRPARRSTINPIWVILAVNVMVFLATLFDREIIFFRFGLIPYDMVHSPWTVFTYMFVHASWGHIISNMLTLYFFGTFAMSLVGEGFFLLTYFVGGIMGGLLFYFLSVLTGHTISILVGASGAIYALGGLLLVMRPQAKVFVFPIPVPVPLWISILVGFLIVSFIPGVAWEAHLGGLIFGAVIGFFFRRREQNSYRYR